MVKKQQARKVSSGQGEIRASNSPLYSQIAERIKQDIIQRHLTAHTKLPSEVLLARQYQVSHGTITKALEVLVRDGTIYRQRPQGTFVAEHLMPSHISALNNQQALTLIASKSPQEKQQRIPSIGMLVPYLMSDFLDALVLSVESVTRSFGYALSIAYTENEWALERYHIEQFLQQGVAGIIMYPGEHAVEEHDGELLSAPGGQERMQLFRMLQQRQVPFVLLDRYVPELECHAVVSDDFTAGYESTQHLIKSGHRRIGFATVSYMITSSANRYAGYRQCLKQYNIPFDKQLILNTLEHAFTPVNEIHESTAFCCTDDRARIADYLTKPDRPDAIVAMNSFVATQILQIAKDLKIGVPNDLALVCSGTGSRGLCLQRSLTSILQPVNEIGRQGAFMLFDCIAGRLSGKRHMILPVSMIVQDSSGTDASAIDLAFPRTTYA